MTAAGGAECWGQNEWGEVGDGTVGDGDALTLDNVRATPVDVIGLGSGVVNVAAGFDYTCALTADGAVKCWGRNDRGQLGDGSMIDSSAPVDVVGLESGVTAISAGDAHTCALLTAGTLMCWGANGSGNLGDGTSNDSLIPVEAGRVGSGVASLTAGGVFTCALTTAGGVRCWGGNTAGQLGDGESCGRMCYDPVTPDGLDSRVLLIAAGAAHICAVTRAGGVKCWGSNLGGRLGDGGSCHAAADYFDCPTPVDVSGLGPKPPLLGDVNCDHQVNSVDAALVLQFEAGLIGSLPSMEAADVNQDGRVSSLDALFILWIDGGVAGAMPSGQACIT